jgi:hypothetical protein
VRADMTVPAGFDGPSGSFTDIGYPRYRLSSHAGRIGGSQ